MELTIGLLFHMYNALVVPNLDYGIINPHKSLQNSGVLGSVRKRFPRGLLVVSRLGPTYGERLQRIQPKSFERFIDDVAQNNRTAYGCADSNCITSLDLLLSVM
ncbi:hypothetical protein AB6A40_008591 [Gnathostoma spinigerum]|uniref:Uncharacterized protein n=1 Tax=Gnathostoma spinigerum TaxID=75299 RepID=A0ABD6ERW1_9BILA